MKIFVGNVSRDAFETLKGRIEYSAKKAMKEYATEWGHRKPTLRRPASKKEIIDVHCEVVEETRTRAEFEVKCAAFEVVMGLANGECLRLLAKSLGTSEQNVIEMYLQGRIEERSEKSKQ